MNTEPSPSSSQQESSSEFVTACPYAKAMKQSTSSTSLPGLIEFQQCPAFAKECPFKSATSAEDVAEQLKRIPLGHMKKNGPLFQSLKYFHETSAGSGSCPVRNSISVPQDWSFHQAMEELSLMAVMAKLILEQESTNTNEEEDSSRDDSTKLSLPEIQTTKLESRSSLSDALKNGTAGAHKAAESVHFVKNFIRGKIDRDLYGLLVAQLYHLYGKLEEALDQHAPMHFSSCHFPKELHRREALHEDVEFWHTGTPKLSPATQDYLHRIQYLCDTNPLLLLAHAYTRYLGDLSGGKVLARVAKRALNLKADDDGLAFYQFPHVQSFKLFKDKYRSALNDLSLNNDQIQALVREANVAFLLNMRLFEELDCLGGVPGASIRPLEEIYAAPHQSVAVDASNAAECPFIINRKAETKSESKCPWPFVVFHDPRSFLRAWQTWLLIGLFLTLFYYSTIIASASSPSPTFTPLQREETNLVKINKADPVFHYGQFYQQWQKASH
jgi:heme oxygenase